jgi:hypothetical protein
MVPAIVAYAATFFVYLAAMATNYPWVSTSAGEHAGHE